MFFYKKKQWKCQINASVDICGDGTCTAEIGENCTTCFGDCKSNCSMIILLLIMIINDSKLIYCYYHKAIKCEKCEHGFCTKGLVNASKCGLVLLVMVLLLSIYYINTFISFHLINICLNIIIISDERASCCIVNTTKPEVDIHINTTSLYKFVIIATYTGLVRDYHT